MTSPNRFATRTKQVRRKTHRSSDEIIEALKDKRNEAAVRMAARLAKMDKTIEEAERRYMGDERVRHLIQTKSLVEISQELEMAKCRLQMLKMALKQRA